MPNDGDELPSASIYADHVILGGVDGAPLTVAGALVEVRGRAIAAVTPCAREELSKRTDHAAILDLGDRLVSPAFINAHVHLPMVAFRGIGGSPALRANVVEELYFTIERALTPEDIRAFARLGAYECLLAGTGLVWEHYYGGVALARGLADAGLAGVVAPTLQDLEGPGASAWEAQLEATIAIDEDPALEAAGVLAAVGPHATDTVSDALWRRAGALAAARGLPIHAHLAQSLEEFTRSHARHGLTPVARLLESGALEGVARALLVHGLYVTDEDLTRLDPARDVLGLCPFSQLQFGFLADVATWARAGVPWIVATDCAASNDSMNLQKELRLVAGIHGHAIATSPVFERFRTKGQLEDARGVSALRRDRHAALGDALTPSSLLSRVWSLPGGLHPRLRVGALAPGWRASFVVWDRQHPAMWPCLDPLRALAMGDTTAAIDGLMIDGRWIGERGRFAESLRQSGEYREATREADARLARLCDRLGLRA